MPLGIVLVRKMIPSEVLAECRDQAQAVKREGKTVHWVAGGIILAIWIAVIAFLLYLVGRWARR